MNITIEPMETNKSDKIEFEKTIRTKEGLTKRICVEKVENGYYISIAKYGDVEGKYIDECKKYISKTNPLKSEKSEVLTLKEFLSEI